MGRAAEEHIRIDLIPERVEAARRVCPRGVTIDCGSAMKLPHADRSIDVILLFGIFCLILEDHVCEGVAREAMRVLKNDGVILWCDYRFKAPGERHLRTFSKREMERFFPGMRIDGHPIHPLPPLLRKVGPIAPFMCNVIGMLPFVRTHYFATISNPSH